MVSFDQLIQKGRKHLARNRDRGTLDITENVITLIHQDFTKEILYDDIESMVRRKKGIITLNLKNGEMYELLDIIWASSRKSFQDMRNAVRKTEMIYNLLSKKLA